MQGMGVDSSSVGRERGSRQSCWRLHCRAAPQLADSLEFLRAQHISVLVSHQSSAVLTGVKIFETVNTTCRPRFALLLSIVDFINVLLDVAALRTEKRAEELDTLNIVDEMRMGPGGDELLARSVSP